jgi:predicted negative regulator of RcsB-dependent stress response
MYLRETQTALAFYEYQNAESVLNTARTAEIASGELADKANLAIAAYQSIIDKYPGTKYADLSHLQIADSYLLIADANQGADAKTQYEKAINAYDDLWTRYQATPPSDAQVSQAVKRAQQQIGIISGYLAEQKKRGQ